MADEANPSAPDSAARSAGPAEKGLADLLVESFRIYRMHVRPMLLVCALVFVPASLAKSCAMSAILAPRAAAASASGMVELAREAEASRKTLADAYARNADAETIARLTQENQRQLQQMSEEVARVAGSVPGRFTLWMLGVLATLVSALAFAIAVPLASGALTIAVADRLSGGHAGWLESWMLLLGRLRKLLAAVVPAAGLIAIGLLLWVIPGLAVAFFFALVAQVAVVEDRGGAAALRRSAELVGADWLRLALLLAVFGCLTWAARLIADFVVPDAHIFMTELLGDLLTLAVLPLPLIAGALLYFDLRRRRDGFDDEALRATLEKLRA